MGAQSPITLADVTLQDYWNCYQKSDGSYGTKNISTVSETVTVEITGIPAGATNIVGTLELTTGSPYSGASIQRVNGYGVGTLTTTTVPVSIYGNGTVSILFEFRPNGHSTQHVASHTSTMTFSGMTLTVTYSEPETGFSTNFGTSINAGETMTITLDSSSSAYSHAVFVKFGSYEYGEMLDAGVTTFSYTIPLTWLSEIPSATSGVGKITVYSLSGDTVIGSASQAFTLTCPNIAGVYPDPGNMSISFTNTKWGYVLQNYSSAYASLSGSSGAYGASISYVSWSCSGIAGYGTTTGFDTGLLLSSGYITVTAVVTDSRGKKSSISQNFYVTPYRPPEISSIYAERCDSDNVGSSTGTGGHILVGVSYTAIGENSITTKVEHKEKSSSVWIEDAYITPSTTVYSLFASEGTFDSSLSYDIRVTVSDTLGNDAISIQTLGTSYAFMQWEPMKNAIGFGCYPTLPSASSGKIGCFEVAANWDFRVGGESILDLISNASTSNIIISATSPTDPEPGTIWLDIS